MHNFEIAMPAADARVAFASTAIESFIHQEALLLDMRLFRDWMALFTEDGTYWVPATPGQENPFNQASLFYDEPDLMKTRIGRLEHPKIHIQSPPSRTMHQIGRVTTVKQPDSITDIVVTSSMIMVEYRQDRQRMFAGRQYHRLRPADDSFRIVHKRVDLVNCDGPFEPMAVPI